jgi:hypothetical protein
MTLFLLIVIFGLVTGVGVFLISALNDLGKEIRRLRDFHDNS